MEKFFQRKLIVVGVGHAVTLVIVWPFDVANDEDVHVVVDTGLHFGDDLVSLTALATGVVESPGDTDPDVLSMLFDRMLEPVTDIDVLLWSGETSVVHYLDLCDLDTPRKEVPWYRAGVRYTVASRARTAAQVNAVRASVHSGRRIATTDDVAALTAFGVYGPLLRRVVVQRDTYLRAPPLHNKRSLHPHAAM